MGELIIRKNRGLTVPQFQSTARARKQTGAARAQAPTGSAAFNISQSLSRLLTRAGLAQGRARESRQTLQTGEVVLAEVKENLERMSKLLQEAAGEDTPDRDALQSRLEELGRQIDRMLSGASVGGVPLFLDEDSGLGDGMKTLLYAVMDRLLGPQDGLQQLPQWLLEGIAQSTLSREQLLEQLGLDDTAGAAQLAAAMADKLLAGDPAAGGVAVLYLGAVISGKALSGDLDLEEAVEGIRQLLEQVAAGIPPDQAVEELTGGEFSGLMDFLARYSLGSGPGMEDFFISLLLDAASPLSTAGGSLLELLAGREGMDPQLMAGLLAAVQSAGHGMQAQSAPGGAARPAEGAATPLLTAQFGSLQTVGRDLSGIDFNADTGQLTVSGQGEVLLRGMGAGGPQSIVLAGPGAVTLQNVRAASLTAAAQEVQVFSAGESRVEQLTLAPGTSLTLSGGGLLRAGAVHVSGNSDLRLTGGAVIVQGREGGQQPGALGLPVQVDGPVCLAAQPAAVIGADGRPLEPVDLLWHTLLPGWKSVTAMEADGRQTRLALSQGDPIRLWLDKGDPSRGYPAHPLVIRGRDAFGRPMLRYTYLRWNPHTGAFCPINMYPNPFTVTGGEQDRDWAYEEGTQTLHILSGQVGAVSGGTGMDADQEPFSGRIALADSIGPVRLTLEGVCCQPSSGRALDLGGDNDVTLFLRDGTQNRFSSGPGCAGVSLGRDTRVHILRTPPEDEREAPAGSLQADGGVGGAGIGRDRDAGKENGGHILISGGIITATGTGGGAGIGAGKDGAIGQITIDGGVITACGGPGGGAGIGGALGGRAGNIAIRGSTLTATAADHAAAIGAGIQGGCGDIRISGSVRLVKAAGGDPGADIGACLFGSCGQVSIAPGVDLGAAQLRTRRGIPLPMGEETVALPQFHLSAHSLRLDTLRVATPEELRAARATVDVGLRWVRQIQGAYDGLHQRLERSLEGFCSIHHYVGGPCGPVRDSGAASTLLADTRQSIPQPGSHAMYTHTKRPMEDVGPLLD